MEPIRRSGLVVGSADDTAEQHADRMAGDVLSRLGRAADADSPRPAAAGRRTSAPVVGRAGGALDADVGGAIEAMRGRGTPLPDEVRTRMESGFGTDLSTVRVHTDERAAELSSTIAARAFTVGRDVFFGAGEYQPDTAAGERTLAHELAHTVAEGGDAAHRIDRLWDLSPTGTLDLDQTEQVSTVGNRQVWFLAPDNKDDRVVVKLETEPLGMIQLASLVHKKVSKVSTVQTKKLTGAERAKVRSLVADRTKLAGDGWAKSQDTDKVPKDPFNGDLVAWGQAVHLAAIDDKNSPMIAMSVAEGKTAEALLDPALATPQRKGIAPFKTVLQRPASVQQLGELSAVDLFLGNEDRVLSGNLGNWFYNTEAEVTAIDHVNEDAAKKRNQVQTELLGKLAKGELAATAAELVASIKRSVRASFGVGKESLPAKKEWDEWFDPKQDKMVADLLKGLKRGRTRVVKTFGSSRVKDVKYRKTKKAIKAQAATASLEDTAHDDVGATDYYDILKQRAKWLSTH